MQCVRQCEVRTVIEPTSRTRMYDFEMIRICWWRSQTWKARNCIVSKKSVWCVQTLLNLWCLCIKKVLFILLTVLYRFTQPYLTKLHQRTIWAIHERTIESQTIHSSAAVGTRLVNDPDVQLIHSFSSFRTTVCDLNLRPNNLETVILVLYSKGNLYIEFEL